MKLRSCPLRLTIAAMILAKHIPVYADDFIRRCGTACRLNKFAKDGNYKELLILETGKSHPKLLEYLKVHDRRPGRPGYWAQVDHIVPQAVWVTLMPIELHGPDRPDGAFMHCLSNLFWRGPVENQSYDQSFINKVREEETSISRKSPSERQSWSKKWIEIFLRTKHDEALVFPGDHVDPSRFEDLPANNPGTNWLGGARNPHG